MSPATGYARAIEAPKPAKVVTLDVLGLGCKATVRSVEGDLSARRRLLEMGLCEGVEIEAIRFAPLGDPIEFRVRGYFISLRASQARQIRIALPA